MFRFAIRTGATALTFYFLLPLIPGIDFHGNFGIAIFSAIVFGFIGWLVDIAAKAISALFAISTLGLGLLILIPLWTLGFWLIPSLTLHIVSEVMPKHITVHGWIAAFEGGLMLFVVGMLTSFKGRQ